MSAIVGQSGVPEVVWGAVCLLIAVPYLLVATRQKPDSTTGS